MPFLKAQTLNESQTASSRIWTWLVDYIFQKDNFYVMLRIDKNEYMEILNCTS